LINYLLPLEVMYNVGMRYTNGTYPSRIKGYMLGFYAAQQRDGKMLIDVPLEKLSKEYRDELARKADKETRHMVGKPYH